MLDGDDRRDRVDRKHYRRRFETGARRVGGCRDHGVFALRQFGQRRAAPAVVAERGPGSRRIAAVDRQTQERRVRKPAVAGEIARWRVEAGWPAILWPVEAREGSGVENRVE